MKKSIFLMVLFMVMCFTVARAQDSLLKIRNTSPQQRAQFQTNLMKQKLKLNDEQVTNIAAVNMKYALRFQPIIKSDDSRFSKLRAAMALQEQKDKELQTIFTKDQYTAYKAFEQDLRNKLKKRFKQ
jgi:hypothetical protein